MSDFIQSLIQAAENVAGEVVHDLQPAQTTVAQEPVPAAAVTLTPLQTEVAQVGADVSHALAGDLQPLEHDAAGAAAAAIAQRENPQDLHNRLAAAESWIAATSPIINAVAKELGISL